MTVYLITTIKRFIGESFDTKPTDGVPVGSTFFETDTKNSSIYGGAAWVYTTANIVLAIRATQGIRITEEEDEYETAYIVGGPLQRLALIEGIVAVVSLPLSAGPDRLHTVEGSTLMAEDSVGSDINIGIVDEGAVEVTL